MTVHLNGRPLSTVQVPLEKKKTYWYSNILAPFLKLFNNVALGYSRCYQEYSLTNVNSFWN